MKEKEEQKTNLTSEEMQEAVRMLVDNMNIFIARFGKTLKEVTKYMQDNPQLVKKLSKELKNKSN